VEARPAYLPSRRLEISPHRVGPWVAWGACVGAAASLGLITASHAGWDRAVFALALAGNVVVLASRWPRAAAMLTVLFLPFLGLLRRLLIADAGWSTYDPLLLVGPTVGIFLFVRLYLLEGRPLARERLEKLVLGLLALVLLESFNPQGGSLLAGLGGVLFLGAPLLWFFIGRELMDRHAVLLLLRAVVVLALLVGAYGLWQTQVGLPSWDAAWVQVNGYGSLNVGGVTRAFGTLSNASEYALLVGAGLVFAVAMALHRRTLLILTTPLFAVALFLASGRTVLVLTIFALLVLIGLRSGSERRAAVVVILGIALAVVGLQAFGSKLDKSPSQSNDPLVSHQLGGLTDPLNPQQSTLLLHWQNVVAGMRGSVSHPLGIGTAASNIAAKKIGGSEQGKGTEVDISNAFVSLGLIGGLMLVLVVALTLRRAILRYLRERDPEVLAVIGLLVVMLGQWLNGGNYAMAPLTWLMAGWVVGQSPDAVPAPEIAPQPTQPAPARSHGGLVGN
jgi:hypothetical protein